ncbi:hypothetical protein ACFFOU_01810 [Pseudonocardia sulfidoxydans]|nr:hypothetical protein [Pseudonocardia sulfidoxydans]
MEDAIPMAHFHPAAWWEPDAGTTLCDDLGLHPPAGLCEPRRPRAVS